MGVRMQVGEDELEKWKEVENFDESGPEDQHFEFNRSEGQVIFGNGVNGRIPQIGDKIWVGPYWISKGSDGNISSDRDWIIEKPGFSGIKGADLGIGSAGSDPEPFNEAEMRARQEFTTVFRAVTMRDYETLALETPGLRVARAKAIPNSDPDYPGTSKPGYVTVVVVPDYWDERPFVDPSDGFIQTVQNHLDAHRLIASQVQVIGPDYVQVTIKCNLKIKKRSDPNAVKDRVLVALKRFFHPLTGGVEKKGWPVGRPIFPSEIYELIDPIDGVDYLTDLVIRAGDHAKNADSIVPIPKFGLVYSGEHKLIFADDIS